MFRSDQIQISRTRWKKGNSGPRIHGLSGPATDRSNLVRDFLNFAGPGPVRSEISKFFLVLVRFGPRISKFSWSWFGSVREFLNFVRPGSVRSEISNFCLVLVCFLTGPFQVFAIPELGFEFSIKLIGSIYPYPWIVDNKSTIRQYRGASFEDKKSILNFWNTIWKLYDIIFGQNWIFVIPEFPIFITPSDFENFQIRTTVTSNKGHGQIQNRVRFRVIVYFTP